MSEKKNGTLAPVQPRLRVGSLTRNEDKPMPKKKDLTYTDVVDICAASLRQSTADIAAEYGITAQRVRQILNDNSELVKRFELAYADAVNQEIVKHAAEVERFKLAYVDAATEKIVKSAVETDSLEQVAARAQDLIDDNETN